MSSHRFRTPGLLGTDVEIAIDGGPLAKAQQINTVAIANLRHLEGELSIHRDMSAMSQWRTGNLTRVDLESVATTRVIELALQWQQRSGGAFDPFVAEVADLWSAEVEPTQEAINEALTRIGLPLVVFDGELVTQLGDCSQFNANAVAKGWVVDQTIDAIQHEFPAARVCIAVGGDLAWSGPGTWRVGIENPLRPYDNEPPLQTIDLPPGAIATSGSARRTLFSTGHSHLIDPRIGRPAVAIASVSVIAARVASADAAATAAGVMGVQEALRWLADEPLVRSALVVAADGTALPTPTWPA